MKKIKVTRRNGDVHFILVDDADFEKVAMYKWCIKDGKNTLYAKANVRKPSGKKSTIRMHRFLMEPKKGEQVDHINHDGLDNRRVNLRVCTRSQNNGNRRKTKGSSKYKGVYWHRSEGKWCAMCSVDGKQKHLGYASDETEAAKAYDTAALESFGEFALTNEMLGLYDGQDD